MRNARLLVVLVAAVLACGDDAVLVIPPCDPCFKELDTRDNLMNNLLLSYNNRNVLEFERLLDPSGAYTFYFSANDVASGLVRDSEWKVTQDVVATQRLFDRNFLPGRPHADEIDLVLYYVKGDTAWEPFEPPSHPTETWYDQAIEYQIAVKVGDTNYATNGVMDALLTVRYTEVAGDSMWQIVEWWDDTATRPGASLSPRGKNSVKQTTWGGIKGIFSPPEPGGQ